MNLHRTISPWNQPCLREGADAVWHERLDPVGLEDQSARACIARGAEGDVRRRTVYTVASARSNRTSSVRPPIPTASIVGQPTASRRSITMPSAVAVSSGSTEARLQLNDLGREPGLQRFGAAAESGVYVRKEVDPEAAREEPPGARPRAGPALPSAASCQALATQDLSWRP